MIKVNYLGLMEYQRALALMESVHTKVQEALERGEDPSPFEELLVVQHPPTVTMGNRELLGDLLIPPEQLKFKGVAYHKIDRGGSVTVHEPGQVVIYPILYLDPQRFSVKGFVFALEQAMIDFCAEFGILASRDPINPGVWVGQNKIGALGIRILNKVTKHGLALNVTNTLTTFSNIIPCGLRDRGVTNLERCLQECGSRVALPFAEIEKRLAQKVLEKLSEMRFS